MKSANKIEYHPLLRQIQAGTQPSLDDFIEAFGSTFDLLHRLKDTAQDAEWHAEGNVYIHTQMVLEQVYKFLETSASHFDNEKRLVLILAAVFHDIAKPLTTRTRMIRGRERITSPHHADRGRSYLAYKLPELGLSPELARQVMALVGHHHDPKQLVVKDAPEVAYKQLARLVYTELLYVLEQADMRGRVAQDLEEQLEYLELFKLDAQDAAAWGASKPYAEWETFIHDELNTLDKQTRDLIVANAIRDAEAGLIFTPHEAIARSHSYRDSYAHLVLTCAPSGAGKSIWVQKHLPDYEVISLDDLREDMTGKRHDQSMNGQVLQAAREQLKVHLRKGDKVVWDATNTRRQFRSGVIQLGFDYQARVTLVVFHLPETTIFERNRQRDHAVAEKVLHNQLNQAEFPYLDEAHDTIYIDV